MIKLEEKFNEAIHHSFDIGTNGLDEYIDKASARCVEITEQTSLDFGRWFHEQCLWNDSYANKEDKELFEIYLKSKENE